MNTEVLTLRIWLVLPSPDIDLIRVIELQDPGDSGFPEPGGALHLTGPSILPLFLAFFLSLVLIRRSLKA